MFVRHHKGGWTIRNVGLMDELRGSQLDYRIDRYRSAHLNPSPEPITEA